MEQKQRKAGKNAAPELYTEAQMGAVERHIEKHFGAFANVWHELLSPDIHVDICIIPPGEERDYYTLVTMGMGAHRMRLPEELSEKKLERAELLICLPPDWKVGESDERWYWPVRLLKSLARLPGVCDTWLGWGHTVDNQGPYAENTALCGSILVAPIDAEEEAEVCRLENGDEVNFYQLIPLYEEELAFAQARGLEALLERIELVDFVTQPARPSVCGEDAEIEDMDDMDDVIMDCAAMHLDSIEEKQLAVEPIAAYNHLAIYLRWGIERDLMDARFLARYAELVAAVKQRGGAVDLRVFLRDELKGVLLYAYFNEPGEAFARYYYSDTSDDEAFYPIDVDGYALRYFGEARYHCAAFQDEAYLFVPYDEAYYQGMKETLEERWTQWRDSL